MKKFAMSVLVSVMFVLCMTGCEKETGVSDTTPQPGALNPNSGVETLTIYSINSDTMTLIPVTVKKSTSKISAKYITNLVLENLNEKDIQVTQVEKENKKAIISFSSKGKPIAVCNKKMENLILECFANSILDNVKGCNKIIFRSDGAAYKSTNNQFGINEVYASQ